MERLIDEFDRLVDDLIDVQQDSESGHWYTTGQSNIGRVLANETKKLAIEFAKSLMDTEVTQYSKGRVGATNEGITKYNPPEYTLMKGELIMNGDKLFNEFIEKYYE